MSGQEPSPSRRARRAILASLALSIGLGCGAEAPSVGATDATVADAPLFPEVDSADVAAPETVADADATIAPGQFGAPCVANADCDSGYCVEGPAGYICTRACDAQCPEGYDCKSVPGQADVSFVCVPRLRRLCTPCSDDLQCAGGACLVSDGAGACAAACAADGDCPVGFSCAPDRDGRAPGDYCQPTTGSCTCSSAQDAGERTCSITTEVGRCFGIERCDPSIGWGPCSARTPGPEQCNGLDDDCNEEIDDGIEDGLACENVIAGLGSCPGVGVCLGQLGWRCDGPMPTPETCNGQDDDCDGDVDEDFRDPSGAFTLASHCGRCGNDCTTRFVNGVGRCDGSDSDAVRCAVDHCDPGFVQLGNQCVTPIDTTCQPCADDADCIGGSCLALGDGVGKVCLMPCAASGDACPPGLACTAFGSIERCAPKSGSCACTPDRAGDQRTCSVSNAHGRCLGIETCGDDAWSPCTAAVPAEEICNGLDDDCDGQVDEEARWEDRGTVCANGLGICRVSGVQQCDPDDRAGPTICPALPGPGRDETCNGLDDDCDGLTDDALIAPQCALELGVCAGSRAVCGGTDGFLSCNAGRYGAHYEPIELSCDALDNDCDGATDDVDQDGDGHIAAACGGDDCDDGKPDVHAGAVEVCGNAIDDDCGGGTDDKDADGDGALDPACGGDDCDDGDPQVRPGAIELWDTKDNDCDGWVDEGVVPVGSLIISEIMLRPGLDPAGEYIELTNLGASSVNLRSWVVADGQPGSASQSFSVPIRVIVAPGATAVLCRSGPLVSGGGYCDYAYGAAMELANGDGQIALTLDGLTIDSVAYTDAFPEFDGRSLNLDPAQFTRTGNDVSGNWCATAEIVANRLTSGDYGTPRRINPSCSGSPGIVGVVPGDGIMHGGDVLTITGSGFIAASAVKLGGTPCASFVVRDDNTLTCTSPAHGAGLVAVLVEKAGASGVLANGFRFTGEDVSIITWVDLQFPRSTSMQSSGVSELIYGQVRAQGITEAAGEPPGIMAQLGYGPLGSDPRTSPGWRWLAATWNKQFYENDEYMRALVIPTPGTYSYTFRFSDDGGTHFMYGDYDPGTADGLSPGNLGTVTVE